MMYFLNDVADYPLMEADLTAWMLARYTSRQKPLPTAKEMAEENMKVNLDLLRKPVYRYEMDPNYHEAIEKFHTEVDDTHKEKLDELFYDLEPDCTKAYGSYMNEYGYPVSFLCDDNQTYSEYYKICVTKCDEECTYARTHVHKFGKAGVGESSDEDESFDED